MHISLEFQPPATCHRCVGGHRCDEVLTRILGVGNGMLSLLQQCLRDSALPDRMSRLGLCPVIPFTRDRISLASFAISRQPSISLACRESIREFYNQVEWLICVVASADNKLTVVLSMTHPGRVVKGQREDQSPAPSPDGMPHPSCNVSHLACRQAVAHVYSVAIRSTRAAPPASDADRDFTSIAFVSFSAHVAAAALSPTGTPTFAGTCRHGCAFSVCRLAFMVCVFVCPFVVHNGAACSAGQLAPARTFG
jgi:hypothetical protein